MEVVSKDLLVSLTQAKMPYGKFKGWTLCDLPEPYLVWYNSKGFPKGKLGMQMATLYEIKLNGLEYLLDNIRKNEIRK